MAQSAMASERTAKLKLSEKLGYGLGDAGFNFYWAIIGSYLAYFYTDIFGLSAAAAATMFLVTKIIDAFTDPMMGAIADRTNSRWGKFRPYLLFAGVPMAGAAVLTMTTPDLSEGGKLIWAYGTYSMMMLCYTIIGTPYSSLAGVITADTQERNSLFGIRFVFAFSTGIVVGVFTPVLAEYFANGNEARGWQMTMLLYGSVATVFFLITFFTTKERVQPPKAQKSDPKQDIMDLLKNKPWIILFLLAMIVMMTIVFRGSSAAYYFKYFVQRPDLMGAYIGIQMASYAVGCLFAPKLAKLMDKAKLLMVLMGIVAVFSIAFAFVPKPDAQGVVTIIDEQSHTLHAAEMLGSNEHQEGDQYQWLEHKPGIIWFLVEKVAIGNGETQLTVENSKGKVISLVKTNVAGEKMDSSDWPFEIMLMFLLNIIISLALGPKSPLTWSMYADTADFNEWNTGRRATAMTFAAASFSQKIGGALGSAGILWVLAFIGYAANQAQEDASVTGIIALQTVVPGIFALIAVFALRYYDLSNAKLDQIQNDLKARQTAADELLTNNNAV